jgi:RNA polymerase sigma-70 factor (ECF subfamily)
VAKKLSGTPREVTLNGQPAMIVVDEGRVVATLALDILDGKVIGVRSVTNPHKLEHLGRQLLLGEG